MFQMLVIAVSVTLVPLLVDFILKYIALYVLVVTITFME